MLSTIRQTRAPAAIVSIANATAYGLDSGTIASTVAALVDTRRSTLTLANAGHPSPLMLIRGGHVFLQRFPADLPLGVEAARCVYAAPKKKLCAWRQTAEPSVAPVAQ